MKFNKSFATILIGFSLILGACASGGEPTANTNSNPDSNPAASPSVASSSAGSPSAPPETTDHSAPTQGGQVVEVGAYHLELVAAPEASGTHLDLFLQSGDTHEAIEGAMVTGEVQLPDGSQKSVDFAYDAEGKHYVAMLPETVAGEYKVVVLSDINGEKVNGRFTFTK